MATKARSKAAKPRAAPSGENAPSKPHGNARRAWKVTRVKAWARWCRFEAEDVLNGTSRLALPDGGSVNHLRDYLLRRLKNPLIKDDPVDDEVLTRSLPAMDDQPAAPSGERRHVTLNAMNGLLESQSGTAWHKYERGSVGELDALTVLNIDGWIPGAKAFYNVGPYGVPIWALMGGVLTVDDVWLPLLHYREGGSEAHRRAADVLELDVLPVGDVADPDGRPAVPRAVADKPVTDRTPEDWRVIDQAMTESLRVGARLLSGYTPEQFRRAIEVGYDLRGPEEDGFMIGDVLLLAIAALIHSGAHSTDDHPWNHPETGWLEDDVFTALRARRPLFDAYGAAFFFEEEIGAWLDAMQAAYLVRNGYAAAPTAVAIDAKRDEYARITDEEERKQEEVRPSKDLRAEALQRKRKPTTVRLS